MGQMITIQYNGKDKLVEQICPGVVKSGSAYLVKCSVTGEYMYHNEERYLKQVAKYGSPELLGKKLVSQAGKRIQKGEDPKPKKDHRPVELKEHQEVNKNNPYLEGPTGSRVWISPEVRAPDYNGPLSCRQRRDGSMIEKKDV